MTKLTYTDEQEAVFDQIIDPTNPVVAIKATARSFQDVFPSPSNP